MSSQSGVEQLIYIFSKLPGLGTRSARRIVLHLLQDKDVRLKSFMQVLDDAFNRIKQCVTCGNLDYEEQCKICIDPMRHDKVITVVETVAELWAIERSESFNGKYHVLNCGNNMNNRDAAQLKLPQLLSRCKEAQTEELIIATNSTLDGQTTAYFITEFFRELPMKTTRLASGIPIGGELDYLDEGTLNAAFQSRKDF